MCVCASTDPALVCVLEEEVMMTMMTMLWKVIGWLVLGGGAHHHWGRDRGRGFLEETPIHTRI